MYVKEVITMSFFLPSNYLVEYPHFDISIVKSTFNPKTLFQIACASISQDEIDSIHPEIFKKKVKHIILNYNNMKSLLNTQGILDIK